VLRSREVAPDGGMKAREVLVVNTHLRAIKNESGEQVRRPSPRRGLRRRAVCCCLLDAPAMGLG
jgi:ribosomal protein L15E